MIERFKAKICLLYNQQTSITVKYRFSHGKYEGPQDLIYKT